MAYLPLTSAIHMTILYLYLTNFTTVSPSTSLKICLITFFSLPIYAFWFVKSYDSLGKNFEKLSILFQRFFKRSVY